MELLVVISIMALLVSILLPSFKRAREDARRTVCVAHLKNLGMGLFTYANDNRDLGPIVIERLGTVAPRNLLSRPGKLVNLGLLWPACLQEPETFHCPSQTKFNYRSRLDELTRNYIAGSYAYAVHIPTQQSPQLSRLRHLAMASDDFVARRGDVGIGRYSHRVGYNVLYTDGSALWYSDPDESISRQSVFWDDETDDVTYETLYNSNVEVPEDQYGSALDVFRAWHAFCYNQPDPF